MQWRQACSESEKNLAVRRADGVEIMRVRGDGEISISSDRIASGSLRAMRPDAYDDWEPLEPR
jgi:hypothetical protein